MGKIIQSLLLCLFVHTACIAAQKKANGSAALWNKKYNEATYACTHNGSSYMACPVQNQDVPLSKQLESGIRATKIHVWNTKEGEAYVCHGVGKDIFSGPYLDKVVEKVPSLFQGWARDALKQMEPINELVAEAFKAAYGDENKPGVIPFNHCVFDPSRKPLQQLLGEIREFLAKNPCDVVTLIVEDHTKNLSLLAQAFEKAGLIQNLHIQDSSKEWPTLGAMIEANKRLVVFVHGDDSLEYNKYPWMHHIWSFAWDTEWNFTDIGALKNGENDVVPKRGRASYDSRNQGNRNKIFIVHHFVTPASGGCKKSAKKVNNKAVLQARIDRLKNQTGCIPNIIQVDFFQYPNNDVFEIVNALNGI